jgi:hypothetical protein
MDEYPNEAPGVLALPILATSAAYHAWILDQTNELT